MLNFKKLKDQLIKDFIIVNGDIGRAAAFSEGMDISEAQYLKYVRELEANVEYLRSENKKLKKNYKTYKEKI